MRYFIAGIGYVLFGLLGIIIHAILYAIIKFCNFLVELTESLELLWLDVILPDNDDYDDDEED